MLLIRAFADFTKAHTQERNKNVTQKFVTILHHKDQQSLIAIIVAVKGGIDKETEMIKHLIIGMMFVGLCGCTDACVSQLGAYGDKGKVKCYSGIKLIYEGSSTGKIKSSRHSDGYLFRDAETDRLVEVSGNCVISY